MKYVTLMIGHRLLLGFGLLMLLLVTMSALSISRLSNLNQHMREVIGNRYPKTVLATDIDNQINIVARSMRNILLLEDQKQIRFASDRIVNADRIINDRLAALDNVVTDRQSRALLVNLPRTQKDYLDQRDKMLQTAHDGIKEGAIALPINDVRPVQSAYMGALDKLILPQRDIMQQSGNVVEQDYRFACHLLIVLAAIGLLLAAAIAWLVIRSITKPISRAVQIAQTAASGDLTSDIDSSGRDETGQLLTALKTMNDSLLTVVHQVRRGSDTIATATREITTGNLSLSSRTKQQAGALEETASALEQLTSTGRQNANHVRQANALPMTASEARSLAQRSAAAAKKIKILISDLVEKFGAGSKLVEHAGITMDEVASSVRRVTDIVGEISTAGEQQSIGIEKVSRAVVLMDQATQHNAALVEEAAAAAQSLQDPTAKLADVKRVFKLDDRPCSNRQFLRFSAL